VLLEMSDEQAELVRSLAAEVSRLSQQIKSVSNYMNIVNTGMGYLKDKGEGEPYPVMTGLTDAAVTEELQKWVDIGAMPQFGAKALNANGEWQIGDGTTGLMARLTSQVNGVNSWTIYFQKPGGEAMQKNLQNKVNDLTTDNQQFQLDLQTIIGRYNATIEVGSNVVKKNATQAEAILNNFRR
jgi:hypothetical protein